MFSRIWKNYFLIFHRLTFQVLKTRNNFNPIRGILEIVERNKTFFFDSLKKRTERALWNMNRIKHSKYRANVQKLWESKFPHEKMLIKAKVRHFHKNSLTVSNKLNEFVNFVFSSFAECKEFFEIYFCFKCAKQYNTHISNVKVESNILLC